MVNKNNHYTEKNTMYVQIHCTT